MKRDKRTYMRCPLCGRQPVQVKRGHLVSHLNPGGVRCSASGLRMNTPAAGLAANQEEK